MNRKRRLQMISESGNATCTDIVKRLEREKELVENLTDLLREELKFITNQDAEALENSMPEKMRILHSIKENRQGIEVKREDPLTKSGAQIRTLKHDLTILWKKASNLNDLSKSMVTDRLAEIDRQLQPFFAGTKSGYDRDGKRSKGSSRTVNTGV
jgi:predicted house-cleaning noncanonical NTP pyrophosphatase (MazG superfamily)